MSETEDPANPMSNLLDRNPNHLWKSTDLFAQSLWIDLGVARAVDTIMFGDCNFFSALAAGTITIQGKLNAGDAWTTWDTISGLTTDGNLEFEAASQTFRYWAVNFPVSTVLLQIGNISLGARLEISQPYDSQSEHGESFKTNSRRSVNGTPYSSQPFAGIESWKRNWTNINQTDGDAFLTLANSVRGMFRPFYMIDMDTTVYLVYLNSDTNLLKRKSYNYNDAPPIELEAFLPGTIVI